MAVRPGGTNGRGTPGPGELGLRLVVAAAVVMLALVGLERSRAAAPASGGARADASGTIRIAGLAQRVEILRDERGIAHVYAAGEREAWFGVGFAHAEDRLAQMIWLRRRALGRSAEIEGESALVADRLARLLGIGRASEAAAERLPGRSRAVLEAYADGVNARLARIREGRAAAPEALATPLAAVEPWQPADSLAVVKLLSWCMGGTLETTLVLDELIQRLDSVQARPFFPGRASVDFGVVPVLPMLRSFEPGSAREAAPPIAVGSTQALCRGIGQPTGGAFVVAPAASRSGAPLLLADWQHAPSVPGLFYELQLSAGELDVLGATIPGSPIFWLGRNQSLAWAALPAGAPIADLFIEALGERPDRYRSGSRWVPLAEREEVFRIATPGGGQRIEKRLLRSTRHGPLIEWLKPDGIAPDSTARALAWTGALPGDGLSSMLALLRLEAVEGVAATLADHHEPVIALTYADRRGRAGVQLAGWLPHRPLPTGLVPVEGRLASFDWLHRIAIDDLPALRLGETGLPHLVAADQPWESADGRGEVELLWRSGDRAARIAGELSRRIARGPLDLRTAADLFADEGTHRATKVVAALLALARSPGALDIEAQEIAAILEAWDGRTSADSAGAAAYHLVMDRLLESLLLEAFGRGLYERYVGAPHVRPQDTIERLVLRAAELRRPGGWTDEARVVEAARRSLREAWVVISHRLGPDRRRWEWGELHRLRFTPFSSAGPSAAFMGKGYRTGGSAESFALAWHRPGVSLEVESASLYRVAMDLSARDRVLSALAPGQSEWPGDANFDDGIARFREGRLALFASERLAIEEESVTRLVLEPAR